MGKAVQKKEEAALPSVIDFGNDAGAGMEGADKDSYAIPFLKVLQQLSPQCDEANAAEFVKGAKPGQLFNTVTQQLYDEVVFYPCAFQRRFLQWGPRGSDGGFRGEHLPEDIAQQRVEGKVIDIDGRPFVAVDGKVDEKRSDRLADTRSHFGILEDGSQVLLALSSTQIKKSKLLMSMLSSAKVNGVTPPTWASRIKISSVKESNDQGSWWGVKFSPEGYVTDPELYAAGKAFHNAIVAGNVKVNFATEAEPDTAEGKF